MDKKIIKASIIDYGMGNIGSIVNAFNRIDISSIVTKDKKKILSSQLLILPGVGSFGQAINNLHERDLFESIHIAAIEKKIPTLGICLGAQLACQSSTENGFNDGFKWFDSSVQHMKSTKSLRVPHVGWNSIRYKKGSVLLKNIKRFSNFYFDHSYFITESKHTLATSKHGTKFSSILQRENIVSVQFHPEKSSIVGLQFLRNFYKFAENYL